MSQVIIFTNSNGGVSVCIPTGELPINEVLIKDCPAGAIIVDDSTFPQGSDAQFFDAWQLNGSTITLNFAKAQSDRLAQYNSAALKVAQTRQLNTLTGISNIVSDTDWQTKLTSDRGAITTATTTAQLIAISDLT